MNVLPHHCLTARCAEFVIASLDLRGNDLTDVGVQMAMRLVVPFRLHLLDARLNKVTAEVHLFPPDTPL